jgi:hypothetical protein
MKEGEWEMVQGEFAFRITNLIISQVALKSLPNRFIVAIGFI